MNNIIYFQPTKSNKKELIEKISKLKTDINNFYESVPEEIEINDKIKLGYFNSFCEQFIKGNYSTQFMDLYVTKMEQFKIPETNETWEWEDYYDTLVTYTMLVSKLENQILSEPIEKIDFIMNALNQSYVSPTKFYISAQLLLEDEIYSNLVSKGKKDALIGASALVESVNDIKEQNIYSKAINHLKEVNHAKKDLTSLGDVHEMVTFIAEGCNLAVIKDFAYFILQLESFPDQKRYFNIIEKICASRDSIDDQALFQIMQLTQFLLLNKQLWLLPEEELEVRCFGKKIEQSEDSKSK